MPSTSTPTCEKPECFSSHIAIALFTLKSYFRLSVKYLTINHFHLHHQRLIFETSHIASAYCFTLKSVYLLASKAVVDQPHTPQCVLNWLRSKIVCFTAVAAPPCVLSHCSNLVSFLQCLSSGGAHTLPDVEEKVSVVKAKLTRSIDFCLPELQEPIPMYRVLDEDGRVADPSQDPGVSSYTHIHP